MPIHQQSEKIILTHSTGASADVYFYGSTLTSWKVDGKERIFLSDKAVLDGSKAIRGGIPLVFPVFGKGKAPHVTASLPQHGFARVTRWKLVSSSEDATAVTVRLGLDHSMITEEFRKLWPFDFSLVYTVILAADNIKTELRVHNIGDHAFDFNTLLHTYFLIPDASAVKVIGLNGLDYVDKVLQTTARQEGDVVIRGEVDSVYANVKAHKLDIQYGDVRKGIQIQKDGLDDIVVWNPWNEKAAGMADFGDEEFHKMICVEAGQVAEFIALAAGDAWKGSQILSLL
ncbi:hypothetical protein CPC16_002611 [Podila verticillata]|nr:hypothetical protein BGZ52_012541 [Haplosporangium bisporale]KAF9212789.1 hypothetical protein BGZ59_006324 [Podila verticillata]KAF9393176.1 hypothetical protein CPC16_002611 [Podila verticillata]KAI9239037.1 MAG: aldose 1-epimerase [Podila humilis]KFH68215.1 hypothetical protein MVEG_05034 [Podila verticillata NRRL 6337]